MPTYRSPPSSPQAEDGAISELQNLSQAAPTSSPPRPDSAAVALSFSAPSKKRDSEHNRSRAVSGVASPRKKKLNYQPSPSRCAAKPPAPMDIDSIDEGNNDVDGDGNDMDDDVMPSPPQLNIVRFEDIALVPPRVTPSPNTAELPPDAEPDFLPPLSRQRKSKPNKSKKMVVDNTFLTDIRPVYQPDVNSDESHSNDAVDDESYSDEMKSFDDAFQKQLYFNFSERRGAEKKSRDGSCASRSGEIDLDCDVLSHEVATTDFRELSRYSLEDLLRCQLGDKFLVVVAKLANNEFGGAPKNAASRQRGLDTGGETVKISGEMFWCLKGRISNCPKHDEIRLHMTESQFNKEYENGGGGFTILFDNTDISLPIAWQDSIDHPDHIMFFGRRLYATRSFDKYFRFKSNVHHLHHDFRQFAAEYKGDSRVSALLYAAYQKRLRLIYEHRLNCASATNAGLFDKQTWNTPQAKLFRKLFNDLCKYAFFYTMAEYQDYTDPILNRADFLNFVELAKSVFEPQWRFLVSLRRINPSDSNALKTFKERQVFCQILAMQRLANVQELSHWALIQTTAYYGWGVKNTVVNASVFWGTAVSNSFRDREYTRLCQNICSFQRAVLRKKMAGVFIFDNVQGKELLRDQRGRSSKFLKGTHQMTNEVFEYNETKYNQIKIDNTYDEEQLSVSPDGMREYELIPLNAPDFGTRVFSNHSDIQKSETPDATGARVKHYNRFSTVARYLTNMSNVFNRPDDHFDQCPNHMNIENVLKMRELCRTDAVKGMLAKASSFQRDSVKDWNPTCDQVTQSMMLGVLPIDEKDSVGAATAFLDMCLKFGSLKELEDSTWDRPFHSKLKRMHAIGDRATLENCGAYTKILQDRNMTTAAGYEQGEIFLDAFHNTAFWPGDWHTGMNMLQSIHKVYWVNFLGPLVKMLKWKRINKDCRDTYYQSCKLTKFANGEASRYLWQSFITDEYDNYEKMIGTEKSNVTLSEADVVTLMADDFHQRLSMYLDESDDEYLRFLSGFVLMSNQFINFVDSYRIQDSIGIEAGYQNFAPIWKMLGQHKYLECHFEQLDTLNKNFSYQMGMEFRINRCTRTYPANTGKDAMAGDESMEVKNRDLKNCPNIRTLAAFCRQGFLVGLILKCKRFVNMFYSQSCLAQVYHSGTGSKNNQTPEKKFIYEVLTIVIGNINILHHRKLEKLSVANLKIRVKTDLTRTTLEAQIRGPSDHESVRLFNGVGHAHTIARNTPHLTNVDESIDIDCDIEDTEDEIDSAMAAMQFSENNIENEDDDDDETSGPLDGYKKYCVTNIWTAGWASISKMNVKSVRANAEARRKRKKALNRYVIQKVTSMKGLSANVIVGEEILNPCDASWTIYAHGLRHNIYEL